jgi:hypothetical protein
MAAKEGWKGRNEYAGDNGRHGVFDDQQCPPRLQCQGEQHTGSDRVHPASNGEEPAIQFGTRLLIGLQQHPGHRCHQHHRHHEEKASQDSDHPEDDHPVCGVECQHAWRRGSRDA